MYKKRGMKYCSSEVNIHPEYKRQQAAIKEVCQELGLVAFYPDYHGADRDKNTVLVYLPEDDEYNRELEKTGVPMGGYLGEEPYRKPLWTFENTDANGFGDYGFANHGTLNLRGLDGCTVIKGAIRFSYYQHVQYEYIRSYGGILGMKEADDTYNDLNRKILKAFNDMNNGQAYIANIHKDEGSIILRRYEGDVRNFECDIAVPKYDEELQTLLNKYNDGDDAVSYVTISERIEVLKGIIFIWS